MNQLMLFSLLQSIMFFLGFVVAMIVYAFLGHLGSLLISMLIILEGIKLVRDTFRFSIPLHQKSFFMLYLGIGIRDFMASNEAQIERGDYIEGGKEP